MRNKVYILFVLLAFSLAITAQEEQSYTSGLELSAEAQTSISSGKTPLWLNANKYGLSSLESNNGYLRVAAEREINNDEGRKWGIGYGADMYTGYNYQSAVNIQQLYLKARYKAVSMTVGQKEEPMEMKSQELSSGNQALGINARPVPGVRIALDDYWDIPGLSHWLGIKGHIFYGRYTDSNWQEDFAKDKNNYCKNILLHTKAAYLRIGAPTFPVSLEGGIQMANQFGGTIYNADGTVKADPVKGMQAYMDALLCKRTTSDLDPDGTGNGNILGAWVAKLNFNQPGYSVHLYGDMYFETATSVFLNSKNGVLIEENGVQTVNDKRLGYKLKDYLVGLEIDLKKFRYVDAIVMEYINTTYQLGPIYKLSTIGSPDFIAGKRDFCNHAIYNSWSHWGQVMGNPLYLSPIYNDDGNLKIKDNRFTGFHAGISGSPLSGLRYRLLATWQKGLGTYDSPYVPKRSNTSWMAEASYNLTGKLKGVMLKGAVAMDNGELLGNNFGGQLTVRYTYGIK